MTFLDIAEQLIANVNDDGEIVNSRSHQIFSSFNDPNIWSPMDIDCAIPNSSFYITKLSAELNPININANKNDQENDVYLIVRHTNDEYQKYIEYLKLEYKSYMKMDQINEIIVPICHTQINSKEGFVFAFLSSTKNTLMNVIDDIKNRPLKSKLSYAINLITTLDEAFTNQNVTGFHISPKTILINIHCEKVSIGILRYIGGLNELKLCPAAEKFKYNESFCPQEMQKKLRPSIRAPNSFSDVYGLAKIVEYLINNEIKIPLYDTTITSALQKYESNRISLNEFKNKMLEIEKEILVQQTTAPTLPNQDIRKTRSIDKIIKKLKPIKIKEGLKIYKLPQKVTKFSIIENDLKLKKVTIGEQTNEFKEEVNILIIGQTGSGKTTFLNGVANYLFDVKWEDDFRLVIVADGEEGQQYGKGQNTQAKSQTDDVTAYTFPWQPDCPVPFSVTLIDTPGFGDVRGMDRDTLIIKQLESLFRNKDGCGIDSLNAVAFVVLSSLARLEATQQYVFDQILKLFGKNVADNFLIVSTFADGGEPQVLAALKEAKIPTDYVSKFNNSALFARRDGDNGEINQFFWKIAQTGYNSIFKINIKKMQPKSLTLTQKVLSKRNKLQTTIINLHNNINLGISQLHEIEQHFEIIEKCKRLITDNKDFTAKVKKPVIKKVDLDPRTYVTNCVTCNRTCHDNCSYRDDDEKKHCCAMKSDGNCRYCGCHWTIHKNMSFKFVTTEVEETITLEELKKAYGDANIEKQNTEQMLQAAQKKYQDKWYETEDLVKQCRKCVNRLHEIALRPMTLSESEYIKIQIENEKNNKAPQWDKRVEWLNQLLAHQKLLENVYNGNEKDIILPPQVLQTKNSMIKSFLMRLINRN